MIKLINRYKKVLRLKTTGTEEQLRIPLKLIIEKIWCRQKENKFEHFFQISVDADMKSTKRDVFQQKTTKMFQSWSNHFWKPIAKVSVKNNTRKFCCKTWNTDKIKSLQ